MLITILVIFLILALLGGVFGTGTVGPLGWSPLGIILLIIIILALTGGLH